MLRFRSGLVGNTILSQDGKGISKLKIDFEKNGVSLGSGDIADAVRAGDPIVGKAQHEDAAVGSAAGPSADTSATDFVAPVVAAAGIVVAVSVLVAAYFGSRTSQSHPEHGAEDGVDGLTWDEDDLAGLSATGTIQ